jgi:glycerophosphoryl diester phosphodiesterase
MTPMADKKFRCIGHRGAAGHAPENTLQSIRKALELSADCIEIDVYCVDGHLLVFHDDRLERTTNGQGFIGEQSFEYLRSLDAGSGERIPILEEVCRQIDRRAGLNIELKGPGTAGPVAERIARFLKQGWERDIFLVSSFDRIQLSEIRRLDRQLQLGVLIDESPADEIEFALDIQAFSVHPELEWVRPEFVRQAHANNLKVYVYTVNDEEDVLRMHEIGVDGVFTDFPDRVRRNFKRVVISPKWR